MLRCPQIWKKIRAWKISHKVAQMAREVINLWVGFLNHRPSFCARLVQTNILFWRFVLPCSDVSGHLIYTLKFEAPYGIS